MSYFGIPRCAIGRSASALGMLMRIVGQFVINRLLFCRWHSGCFYRERIMRIKATRIRKGRIRSWAR